MPTTVDTNDLLLHSCPLNDGRQQGQALLQTHDIMPALALHRPLGCQQAASAACDDLLGNC